MIAADYTMAREIAAWKRRISAAWDKIRIVSVKQFDMGKEAILIGHKYTVEAVVDTGGVDPKNLGVEMIVANQITDHNVQVVSKRELTPDQARRIAGLLPHRSDTDNHRLLRYRAAALPEESKIAASHGFCAGQMGIRADWTTPSFAGGCFLS